ncbi:MAG: hypothetical protein QM639_17510 [Rhodocyclaceae bacterium]
MNRPKMAVGDGAAAPMDSSLIECPVANQREQLIFVKGMSILHQHAALRNNHMIRKRIRKIRVMAPRPCMVAQNIFAA